MTFNNSLKVHSHDSNPGSLAPKSTYPCHCPAGSAEQSQPALWVSGKFRNKEPPLKSVERRSCLCLESHSAEAELLYVFQSLFYFAFKHNSMPLNCVLICKLPQTFLEVGAVDF